MNRLKLRTLLSSLLVTASLIILCPTPAQAEWRGDNNSGWWYADGNGSYYKQWKLIEGKWYYFNEQGWMLRNTTIDGYNLGSDGAWVKDTSSTDNLPSWEKKHENMTFSIGFRRANDAWSDEDEANYQAKLQKYWENQKEVDEKYRAKKKLEGTWTQLDAANYYNLYMTTYYQEIYRKKDYESYEQMVNVLSKGSGDKIQKIDGQNYCFNEDGSLLYCARIDNTHYADKSGQLSKDQENGTKLYIDGKGNEEFVEPSWLIKEKNYKETQSSNTVSNDINTNNKTDTSKVLSSGMTLKQAKLQVDSTIAGIKALGETVENNMDYINKLCTSMGTTYDEIKSFQG